MINPPVSNLLDSLKVVTESQLAHAAMEGVVMIDGEQRIVMINPAGLAMFGLTRAQALGMPLFQLIPVRLRAQHALHVQSFQASGQIERSMGKNSRAVGLRSNGEEFPLEAAIFRSEVVQPTGTQTYYTALLRDMSELRRMNSVIDQLNQRLRSLFERVPVAVWITEGEQVVFANRAIAQLTGLDDPSALVGRSIFEFLTPSSQATVKGHMQALGDEDAISVLTGAIRRADGTLREVELVVGTLPDGDRKIIQMVINDITQRTREKKNLLRSRRALRELSASLVEAREEERQRIARELHDELGQKLSAMKLEISACMREHPNPAVVNRARGVLDILDETVASARRIAMDLRPLMLDDLGLAEAIDWQVQAFSRRSGIKAELQLDKGLDTLQPKLIITVYRIVQEALTNITRHAQATRVSISLECQDQELHLVIQDNGIGFPRVPQARRAGSFGLLGIRERVLMLGGRLTVGNARSGGARLTARVPLTLPPFPDVSDEDAHEPIASFFENSGHGALE